jgi:SM-20-related protein
LPKAEFFHLFGLYSSKNFLTTSLCETLRAEIHSSNLLEAGIRKKDGTFGVNPSFRSAKWGKVSSKSSSEVKSVLAQLQSSLEKHFQEQLTGFEEPQFLIYHPGDFYSQHGDSSKDPESADYLKKRRVSIVVFLNAESDQPHDGCYGGGALTFYGLINDPRMKNHGLPLVGEEGMLIAFPSDIIHEVTPVTHGERFTIVSWFYALNMGTGM